MINVKKKMRSKLLMILLLTLILPLVSFAQGNPEKVIEKSFSGIEHLEIKHRNGPLVLKKSADNQVHIQSKLILELEDPSVADVVFKKLEIDHDQSGSHLSVQTKTNIRNWRIVSFPKKNKIVFKDGTAVKGVKKMEIEMTVAVPKQIKKVVLENRYEDIDIREISVPVNVELYSGTLSANQVLGDLDLHLKYSKAYLKDIGAATLDLYDSKLEAGETGKLEIKSKYSEVELGEVASLNLEAYDDKYKIESINGPLKITDKYSDFRIRKLQSVEGELYDSDFETDGGTSMTITSKYSKFILGQFNEIVLKESHDDEVRVDQLNTLRAHSKYSDYKITAFNGSLEMDSYDDDLVISRTEKGLSDVKVTGKYTNIELPLSKQHPSRLEAQMKYGKIQYPEDLFETQIYREKDSQIEVKAKMKGANEKSPLMEFETHDCKIYLRS